MEADEYNGLVPVNEADTLGPFDRWMTSLRLKPDTTKEEPRTIAELLNELGAVWQTIEVPTPPQQPPTYRN